MPDEHFETDAAVLRYDTGKPWNDPERRARWQLLGSRCDGLTGRRPVLEDDVPVDRALAIAGLLGQRDEALQAMREEAARLAESSRKRLVQAREQRTNAELLAVAERRAADRLRKTIARVG